METEVSNNLIGKTIKTPHSLGKLIEWKLVVGLLGGLVVLQRAARGGT